MPRVTFSNELNDFVKAFGVGANVVNNAKETQLLEAEHDLRQRRFDAEYADGEERRKKLAAIDADAKSRFAPGGAGVTQTGGAPSAPAKGYDPSKVPTFINNINDKYALPPGYMANTGWIESHFDPNAHAKGSSAAGMYQFTNGTAKDYGLTNRYDALQSAEAAAKLAVDNGRALRPVLGRAPIGSELYLAQQQGAAGAKALLDNPSANVIDALAPAYKGNLELARKAVVNNGGRPDMTAGEFANMWLSKYKGVAGDKNAALDFGSQQQQQFAAHGGMIHGYEDGGAVPAYDHNYPDPANHAAPMGSADQPAPAQKPYYATDLMDDVGSALGKLGEVVTSGLKGLQEMFGLNERPAVAQADPGYQSRVGSFLRGDGAPPPEQVQQIKSTVDPENQLGDALGTTYGMVKAYEYYLSKGDTKAAQASAASLIQYTKSKSQQLGALAVHALQQGDTSSAAKALQGAFNLVPNGQEVKFEGDKAVVVDQRTGQVVKDLPLTPDLMMNAAMGFTDGSAYLNSLTEFAVSDTMKKEQMKEEGRNTRFQENQEGKDRRFTEGEEGKDRRLGTTEEGKDRRLGTTEEGKDRRLGTTEEGKDRRLGTTEEGKSTRLGVTEQGKNTRFREGEEGKDRRQGVDVEFRRGEGAANRASREGIANQNDQTRRSEGAANRSSREGVAADNRDMRRGEGTANRGAAMERTQARTSSSERNTDVRVNAAGQRQDKAITAADQRQGKSIAAADARQGRSLDAADRRQDKSIASAGERQQNSISSVAAGRRAGHQTKEIDRVSKMDDFAIMGVDPTVTQKVSAGQAQVTREIARGVVEGGGRRYGDEGVDVARKITAIDPKSGKALYPVKLNANDNSVTMPDGSVVTVSPATFQQIAKVRRSIGAN